MIQLTGAASMSSEQHQDLGRSRTKQDHHDCAKFIDWLSLRNPFLTPDRNLQSLSTGLISTDNDEVNCEQTEDVGRNIQATLDEEFYNTVYYKT